MSVWLCACESPPKQKAATPARQQASPGAVAGLTPAGIAFRNRITNTENGLHVRRLMVLEQPEQIHQAIAQHAETTNLDAATLRRLRTNGFRIVRMPVDQVDSFIASLGNATYDANEWHGQVHEWRSLLERPIETTGRAVAIDGVVRRYAQGEFRLMIRSWTVQMENGPFVHLEFLPRRRLPQNNDLRRMLSQSSGDEQSFGSMALDLNLAHGFAYVLTTESPQNDWPKFDVGEHGQTSDTTLLPSRSSRTGPMDTIGPDVAAPPTLGELLLIMADREPRTRTLIILVPRIASDLFLPEQVRD